LVVLRLLLNFRCVTQILACVLHMVGRAHETS
jgi:hypothetical protein